MSLETPAREAVRRLLIIGGAGRMGQALVRAVRERPDMRLVAAIGSEGSAQLGRDVGELAGIGAVGVVLAADLSAVLTECDVAIDFSHPSATAANLAACCAAGKPLLVCTTGHAVAMRQELERAAKHIALLVAPNTSLGITLLLELVRQCAQVLPADFDAEILESHHRAKTDSPSGTALALGHVIAEARGLDFEHVGVRSRVTSDAPRREGEIGFAVLRGGDAIGDHTVIFAGSGEQLILGHRATDRAIFARGALNAAAWLAGRPPGYYRMRDILLRNSSL